MLERPEYTQISRETEGEESTMFRSKFIGWDDIVPFDYTMTADTVQRRGADVKVISQGPVGKKSCHFLLIFGKFMKNGAFFVFIACSESL